MGNEKAQNMMMRQAILSASADEFAAVLQRLAAPDLLYADQGGDETERLRGGEAAARRPRRRPRAVTQACCDVYAAGVVARGRGSSFFCVDLGRAAMQPGTSQFVGAGLL
jgi:hypothetical protein